MERAVTDERLLLLSPTDNVLVARETIGGGETLVIEGLTVRLTRDIALGHKLARLPIAPGEKVLKYGAPIGSATAPIAVGDHVHIHNIKSDYTATHVIERAPEAGS
jgi:hypothetical protein